MRYGRAVRRPISLDSLDSARQTRGLCSLLGLGKPRIGTRPPPPARKPRFKLAPVGSIQYGAAESLQTTACPSPSQPLPEKVRSVMRLLPHSIVVCTSVHGGTPRGMTMSSFTSLSLSPTPLISFNIATPSRTLDAIKASQHFHIHVVAGDASGAGLAHRFTRGNLEDVFRGLRYITEPQQPPPKTPLLWEDGVLYALRCRLLPDEPTRGLIRVRDHVIVIGEVLGVMPGSGMGRFGLAYADRKYRQVGGVVTRDGDEGEEERLDVDGKVQGASV